MSTPRPNVWTSKFLQVLKAVPNVAAACRAAGVSRNAAYKRRESDPDFAAAWDEAVESAVDDLVGEAWRRASFGVEKPVYYQGEECGSYQVYSDGLLMFLLKAHRRETYGDAPPAEDGVPYAEIPDDAPDVEPRRDGPPET